MDGNIDGTQELRSLSFMAHMVYRPAQLNSIQYNEPQALMSVGFFVFVVAAGPLGGLPLPFVPLDPGPTSGILAAFFGSESSLGFS